MSKSKMLKSLDIAGKACTDEVVKEIQKLLKLAKRASETTFKDIEPSDVIDIQKQDTLVRLQRNALALSNILQIAQNTAVYLRQEIAEIVKVEIDKTNAIKERQKAALDRAIKSETKRKYNKAQADKKETPKEDTL